ncbi:MAG: hypothetical protein HY583_01730, partial [Candidatus Omnitrophica bacterium]|nr:hypothetical protein [Candidatus Omnitrophota bacterium]
SVSDPVSNVGQNVGPVSRSVNQVDRSAALVQPDLNPYNIIVPEEFGSVEEVFQGAQNSPLVIHIQNVHANYEAQMNIKGILNHLVEAHKFSLIQLEGAVSKLDPQILQPSYLKEANLKLVDFLMREGRITGADAFAVETDKPVELYGIEDQSLYMENLKMFKAIYKHQEELKPYFDEIDRLILNIGPKLFDPELLDFTRKTEEFSTDKIDILDYLLYLNALSERHKLVSLSDLKQMVRYPNLVRLMKLHALESKLNKNGLQKETKALKLEFEKKVPASPQRDELLSRLDESVKGINPRSYFVELTKLADEAKIDFLAFPAFRIFAEFLIHQDEIDHRRLFSELKDFEKFLQENLFTKEDETAFLEVVDFVNLLKQYFRLEMSREKIALYVQNKDQIRPSVIAARLSKLAAKYDVSVKSIGDAAKLDSYMGEVEYFYQLVLKRDEVFTEKILARMKSLGQNKTILVTGGFHKDGLIDYFRKDNISYVVVNPKVDIKEGNENYLKVMLEDEAVVGSVYAGTFAIEAIEYIDSILRRFSLPILAVTARTGADTIAVSRALDREISNEEFAKRINDISRQRRATAGVDLRVEVSSENLVDVAAGLFPFEGEPQGLHLKRRYVVPSDRFIIREENPFPYSQFPRFGLPRKAPPVPVVERTPFVNQARQVPLPSRVVPTVPSLVPGADRFGVEANFLFNTFVPQTDFNPELIERLGRVSPAQAGQIRAELRKGEPLSVALIERVSSSRDIGKAVQAALATGTQFSEDQARAENFLNSQNVSLKDGPGFLAFAINTTDEEVARAEVRAAERVLKINPNMALAIYVPEGGRRVVLEALNATPDELATDAVYKRILVVEEGKDFETAVARFGKDAAAKGVWQKHLGRALGVKPMPIPEFSKRIGLRIPSIEAGRQMSERVPGITQILEVNADDQAIGRNAERLAAVRSVEIMLLGKITGIGEAVVRQAEDLGFAMQHIGMNQWQISSAAVRFIVELHRAELRIATSV